MRLRFRHDGSAGAIEVDVRPNLDPRSLGCDEDNLGFPACTATVSFDGAGYSAMFGWVQLVRSTDAQTPDFEKDPWVLFPDVDHPYPFYGHKPTLFDAPGRTRREDMDWLAHSFLAVTPIGFGATEVVPLQGFSWGFTIRASRIELTAVSPLQPDAWTQHLPYLGRTYPAWQFTPIETWG